MKNKDIKILVEGWRKFLNESLNISKQIERAKALIDEISVQEPSKNKFKLHIEINKTDVCEYELVSAVVKNDLTYNKVANIYFSKDMNKKVIDNNGIERSCFSIDYTKSVRYNLGPLMYDIIIEFASKNNSMLVADRYVISGEAQSLWQNYFLERPDVLKAQLDIENDHLDPQKYPNLTPQFEDDFRQDMAIKHKKEDWHQSAFSKGYYKLNTPVIDTLTSKSESGFFDYKENV
jgi:hypothetical protein